MRWVCFLFLIFSNWRVNANYAARVWQSLKQFPDEKDFPEIPLLQTLPNTAISFNGGGSRAHVGAIGVLAALSQLDLLKNIRYIGGISGGGWATTAFTFAQNVTDDVLLGEIVPPEAITQKNLQIMDSSCTRGYATRNFTGYELDAYFSGRAGSLGAAWCEAVSKTYLEPAGILPRLRFSWNKESVEEIIARNPNLKASDFQIPVNANRPFPILGMTVVGPFDGVPYASVEQNYSFFDVTPLYVGQMKQLKVEHTYNRAVHSQIVGGAIEPYAFTVKGKPPTTGLAQDQTTAILDVPESSTIFDLQYAAGTGSFASGPYWASIIYPIDIFSLGFAFDYWSPTLSTPTSQQTVIADGGNFQNIPLLSFLQRRVEKIALFVMSSFPLYPAEKYNPYTDEYTGVEVTDDFACYFGVWNYYQSDKENRSYEYDQNQVFATKDYAPVIVALQTAQSEGNAAIASFNLTTIENKWWGIPAGIEVEIICYYLSRSTKWESRLSPEMYSLLVPQQNTSDLSTVVTSGPYANFPFYATSSADLTNEKANVLADLTGWSILQHAEVFQKFFS